MTYETTTNFFTRVCFRFSKEKCVVYCKHASIYRLQREQMVQILQILEFFSLQLDIALINFFLKSYRGLG
jgi:hypothetical protein